jgi:phage terminase large subunit-like protein
MLDLSCPDWFEKLSAGRSPLPDNLPLDEQEAVAAVTVFDKLRLPDVPGQPLLRDVAGQWARDFVAAIFGSVELSDDRTVVVSRKIRKFFQLVPKKNSKTTNGAAIMLTAMLRNRRPNAEFLLVGPTQATATLAYDQAAGMVAADPWLRKRFHSRGDNLKTIEDRKTGAKLRVKSFDSKVMTGVKPVAVLVDELHELGKIAYAQKIMTQIEGGIIANPEGFIVIITTQSNEQPTGVFKAELDLARAVRDGEYEGGETLPMLYEFPMSMQADEARSWEDPKNWPLVLPNNNRSITVGRLLPLYREAKEKGIDAFKDWASQHLNIQIGVAVTGDRWRGADYWADQADETLTLEELIARSEVATVGIDGGGLDDLLGLSVIGREKHTRRWLMWNHAFAHPKVLEIRKEIAANLRDFEKEGSLHFGEMIENVTRVADYVCLVRDAGLLPDKNGVGVDPARIAQIFEELALRNITEPTLRRLNQTAGGLSPAIWGLEVKLSDGTLTHSGLALMNWVVGNAKVEMRGNDALVTKQVSGRAKIDPLIASFNAAILMSWNPAARGVSFWEAA